MCGGECHYFLHLGTLITAGGIVGRKQGGNENLGGFYFGHAVGCPVGVCSFCE